MIDPTRQPKKSEPKKTLTTCEKYGHLWEATTSPGYRRCYRFQCHRIEKNIDGLWTYQPSVIKTEKQPLVIEAESWIDG